MGRSPENDFSRFCFSVRKSENLPEAFRPIPPFAKVCNFSRVLPAGKKARGGRCSPPVPRHKQAGPFKVWGNSRAAKRLWQTRANAGV